jgi:PAS domain S-box-containing protein
VLDASIKMAFKLFDANMEIEESDKRQKTMLSNTSDVLGIIGVDGLMKYKSPNIEKWFGWEPEDLVGTNGFQNVHSDDLDRIQKAFTTLLECNNSTVTMIYQYKCKDGTFKPIELTATNLTKDPLIKGVLLNYHDITERKQVDQKLFQSEKQYRMLFKSMIDGVCLHEIVYDTGKAINYRILDANPKYEQILQFKKEDIVGKLATEVYKTDDAPYLDVYAKVAETGESDQFEVFFPPMEKHFLITVFSPEKDKFATVFEDITEQKKAQDKLLNSENLLRKSQEIAQIGTYVMDISTGIWESSAILDDIFGIDKEYKTDVSGWLQIVHPKDRDMMQDYFTTNVIENKEAFNKEYRIIRNFDQQERWVHGLGELKFVNNDTPIKMIGTIQDITEQKQSEEALRESKDRFQIISQLSSDYYYSLTITPSNEMVVEWISESFESATTYPSDEIKNFNKWMTHIHPDDIPNLTKKRKALLNNNVVINEYRVHTINDETRWFSDHLQPEWDEEQERVTRIFGSVSDITKRKQAEEEIKSQNSLLSMIMETSPVGIVTVDSNDSIIYANLQAEQILGIEKSKITTRKYNAPSWNPTDINGDPFPDENLPFSIVKTTGKSVYNIQHGIKWPDGKHIILSVNASPLGGQEGQGSGMVATFEDITDRKNMEDKIKFQLEEKEIILKETHHRIKNNFATIISLLSLQSNSLTNPEAISALNNAIGRVNSMQVLYEKLMLTHNYQTTSIKLYLNDLIDDLIEFFPKEIDLKVERQIDDFQTDSKQLFPIGIIVNELLTNIMKYAFKGRDSGFIEITLKEYEGEITLIMQDNGRGLPEGFDIEDQKGFGLMLIKMLTQQLDGSFTIDNHKGTRSVIKFPI